MVAREKTSNQPFFLRITRHRRRVVLKRKGSSEGRTGHVGSNGSGESPYRSTRVHGYGLVHRGQGMEGALVQLRQVREAGVGELARGSVAPPGDRERPPSSFRGPFLCRPGVPGLRQGGGRTKARRGRTQPWRGCRVQGPRLSGRSLPGEGPSHGYFPEGVFPGVGSSLPGVQGRGVQANGMGVQVKAWRGNPGNVKYDGLMTTYDMLLIGVGSGVIIYERRRCAMRNKPEHRKVEYRISDKNDSTEYVHKVRGQLQWEDLDYVKRY